VKLVLQLLMQIFDRIGVREQQLARRREAYAVTASLE
jgi:hypothetical protein